MKIRTVILSTFAIGILCFHAPGLAQSETSEPEAESTSIAANEKLVILWTSGDGLYKGGP